MFAQYKTEVRRQMSEARERLRILIRLSKDLTYIDFKRYERLSLNVDEIGRMLGGWIKYCVKNGSR